MRHFSHTHSPWSQSTTLCDDQGPRKLHTFFHSIIMEFINLNVIEVFIRSSLDEIHLVFQLLEWNVESVGVEVET